MHKNYSSNYGFTIHRKFQSVDHTIDSSGILIHAKDLSNIKSFKVPQNNAAFFTACQHERTTKADTGHDFIIVKQKTKTLSIGRVPYSDLGVMATGDEITNKSFTGHWARNPPGKHPVGGP